MSPEDLCWWATYNAALNAFLVGESAGVNITWKGLGAYEMATNAHGHTPDSYKGHRGDES